MIPLQVFFVAIFFEHSIKKSIKKRIFGSFWQDLGFRASLFFRQNLNLKSIKKRIFDSFWQDLGFRASFWRDPGKNSSNMEKNDIEIRKPSQFFFCVCFHSFLVCFPSVVCSCHVPFCCKL